MNTSFLIGSGFSIPYGMPSVGDINKMFTSIGQDEIYYGLDGRVTFLRGQDDPNGWMKKDEKNFFVQFIAHYCANNGGVNNFNYEVFFDYYYGHYTGNANPTITQFCDTFRSKTPDKQDTDDTNLLLDFHNIFSQLLGAILRKSEFYENTVYRGTYSSSYDVFLRYIKSLIKDGHTVNLHTLNHDLLLDHMCQSTDLKSEYCDGFSELGSPYYGSLNVGTNIKMGYKVRVKQYDNSYDKQIRLFKLHGSIDNHWFNLLKPPFDRTLIKSTYGVSDFWKEVDDSGNLTYQHGYNKAFPSFLSGTTTKISQYGEPFYSEMLDHFEENLTKCDRLIIIGYGFWDTGINERINKHVLKRGLTPLVISPSPSSNPFYKSNTFKFVPKGIQEVSVVDFN